MKSYVVIGLGRFGTELATRLYACGEEVMAIDTDELLVDKIADRVTRAVAADARDADVLKKLGVENFDRAIVALGSDLAASALITMHLKSLGVPYIMCKATMTKYWRSTTSILDTTIIQISSPSTTPRRRPSAVICISHLTPSLPMQTSSVVPMTRNFTALSSTASFTFAASTTKAQENGLSWKLPKTRPSP